MTGERQRSFMAGTSVYVMAMASGRQVEGDDMMIVSDNIRMKDSSSLSKRVYAASRMVGNGGF